MRIRGTDSHKAIHTTGSIDISHSTQGLGIRLPILFNLGAHLLRGFIRVLRRAAAPVRFDADPDELITCPECEKDGIPARIYGYHYCEEFQNESAPQSADSDVATESTDEETSEDADPTAESDPDV